MRKYLKPLALAAACLFGVVPGLVLWLDVPLVAVAAAFVLASAALAFVAYVGTAVASLGAWDELVGFVASRRGRRRVRRPVAPVAR